MVFRRRDRRAPLQILTELLFPRGGWLRATRYVLHRLRRLPDPPHRIARGIMIGIFVSFTPFFGLHFVLTAILAWAIRGNLLAGLLATFVGNPVTFPLIALASVEIGHWILGGSGPLGFTEISAAFSAAWIDLWHNFRAIFTTDVAQWAGLRRFLHEIFLPYLIGGIAPGIVAGFSGYFVSLPLLQAYKALRDRQRRDRAEKKLEKQARAAEKERKRAEAAAARTRN